MAISEQTLALPKIQQPSPAIKRPILAERPAAAIELPKRVLSVAPWDLPDQYAMIVQSDCLVPEVPHGTTLAFDKNAPYGQGDLVALFKRPELVKPGDHQVIVKRIVLMPPHWVTFPYRDHPDSNVEALLVAEQTNPPRQFSIPCQNLLAIHKCIGPMRGHAPVAP